MKHCTRFPSFNGPDYSKPIEIGHFFIVLQQALFQAISAFNASVSSLVGELRRQC